MPNHKENTEDMIIFDEVREYELIPNEILHYIPETCEICGKPLEFSDNLTFLACSNEHCPSRVAARIEAMCKFLQIDGFGESTSQTIALKFKLMGPAQLFVVARQIATLPEVPGWETKRQNILTAQKKELRLWEYVKALSLPGINSTARSLFEGYENLNDFYEDLDEQQVPLVAARMGIKSSLDEGVLAVRIYNTLLEYRSEILGCQQFFTIKKENKDAVTINICITQKVPGYTNKPAFIQHLRSLVSDRVNIVQVDRVTEKTHILVGDPNSGTAKMKRAHELNAKAGQTAVFIGGPEEVEDFVTQLDQKAQEAYPSA